MMYVGIVGALTPFGRVLIQAIKESKVCQVLFTVDEGYEACKPAIGQYRTVDEALTETHAGSFYIIDVISDEKTAERAMNYRFYGVSAIVCGLTLTEQDIHTLEKGYHVRRRTFAPVVVEPEFNKNKVTTDEEKNDMLLSIKKILLWLNFGLHPIAAMKQVYYRVLPKLMPIPGF